jgi:hypothetical protein
MASATRVYGVCVCVWWWWCVTVITTDVCLARCCAQLCCLATCIAQIVLNLLLVDFWRSKRVPKGMSMQLIVVSILVADLIIYTSHTSDPDWHVLRALR